MKPLVLAFAFALCATSALAQAPSRDGIVRGLCQPDGCDEFTILAADRLTASDEGALFKTRLKTFHASYGGRKDLGEENGYVYCSRTKPAIMAEQNGRTMAFFLAPFATEDSRETVRRNANFHALYFTLCHGPEAGKTAVHNLAGVAQTHGYRVGLAQSKLVALNRAEDVMTPGDRPPAEAPRDKPPERPPVAVDAPRPERPPVAAEAPRPERQADRGPPPRPPARAVEEDKGLLAAPRRLTNRAFDALDELGDSILGRR